MKGPTIPFWFRNVLFPNSKIRALQYWARIQIMPADLEMYVSLDLQRLL